MRSAQKREKSSHGYNNDFSDIEDSLHGSSHGLGSPSKSALRAFKGISVSADQSDSLSGRSNHGHGLASTSSGVGNSTPRRTVPGATVLNDEKRKAKADANRVYFTSIGITIVVLLVLIIFSLEGLKTEEELRYAAYPTRLEDFGFRSSQLRATVRQMFLDGTLNLTMFMINDTSSVPYNYASANLNADISSVLQTSLERCNHQWTDDKLEGRCHGLKSHRTFYQIEAIDIVPSPTFCKALCCELGDSCSTWQYLIKNYPAPRPSETECLLGGHATMISPGEIGQAGEIFCESWTQPKWRGKRLVSRTVNNETSTKQIRSTFGREFNCDWGIDLPVPCEGLGKVLVIPYSYPTLNYFLGSANHIILLYKSIGKNTPNVPQ